MSKTTLAGDPDATVRQLYHQPPIATVMTQQDRYNHGNVQADRLLFLTCDPLESNELLDWYRMLGSSSDSWSD